MINDLFATDLIFTSPMNDDGDLYISTELVHQVNDRDHKPQEK